MDFNFAGAISNEEFINFAIDKLGLVRQDVEVIDPIIIGGYYFYEIANKNQFAKKDMMEFIALVHTSIQYCFFLKIIVYAYISY